MNDTIQNVTDTLTDSDIMASAAQNLFTTLAEGKVDQEALSVFINKLIDLAVAFGGKIIAAVIVYLIGRWICRHIRKVVKNLMIRKNVDTSLTGFINSLVSVVLNFTLIIIIISILGIETSSFIALFGAAGVAIGMALSGTLQNFAGGVMILLFKPFRIGDYIEAQGYAGTVKEIQIFNTIICTPDNKLITLPNGALSTSSSVNYSKEEKRRVDFTFDIAYGDSFSHAKEVITEILKANKDIDTDPAYFIAINNLDASSVKIVVRVWTNSANYWGVYFDVTEKVYQRFTEDPQLNIPFNQLDVHITKE